jgi:integrase
VTVHERDGRIIVDTIWPDGKRTRRRAMDERQAKDLDIRIRSSRIDGTWRELRKTLNAEHAAGMTLKEVAEIYSSQYVKTKNRDQRSKKSRLSILVSVLGNPLLADIDLTAAHRFATKRCKTVSARTVNRDLAVLRHLLEWARKHGLIERNPLQDWERLAEQPFEGQRPYEEYIDQIFEHLREDVAPLFTFLRETGCRREEGLALKWTQVDLRNKGVTFFKTKSGRPRTVPLTQDAIAAIKSMPRTSKTPYVFYHPASLTRWSEAKDPWEEAREAAGYPRLRIHDLRHAYAIKLAEAGVPMEVISEMLGHHSVDFTKKHYAKYAPTWAGKTVLAALEGGRVAAHKRMK